MNYEKAYKEALERARTIHNEHRAQCHDVMVKVFPELAESKDERISREITEFLVDFNNGEYERPNENTIDSWLSWLEKQGEQKLSWDSGIRKNLICFFKREYGTNSNARFAGIEVKDIIAWLEKQGEQKPNNNTEPKFNVGDFVHCTTINGFEYTYIYKSNHGEVIHAFVIYSCGTHGVVSIDDMLFEPSIFTKRKATTEEIITLLQSIHKNGFIWDTEKKELKKIEQKPFDYENANIPQKDFAPKVEPKFKGGDWVVDNRCGGVRQVVFLEDDGYEFQSGGWVSYEDANKHFHIWTINDAKEGDVLAFKDGTSGILLYKENTENFGVLSYCRIIRNNFIDKEESGWGSTLLSPATKEQCDFLFQKMKEVGYEWDGKKKKLKKIEQRSIDNLEPKFKVGDYVANDDSSVVAQIEDVSTNVYYTFKKIKPSISYTAPNCEFVDRYYHLWTIEDVKDGDVLVASDGSIFIFKEVVDCGCKHYIALAKDSETINVNDNLEHFWEAVSGIKPSTKEQHDLLFQKMKEAGYTWDAEKKELTKNM